MEMEKVKSDRCCLFCYRTFDGGGNPSDQTGDETQKLFLRLLQRYLSQKDGEFAEGINSFHSSESLRNVISPCADCSGIMNSFCEFYEEMQVAEIKMRWRLQTLMRIVESSEKVKCRRRLFQEKLEKSNEVGNGTGGEDIHINISDNMKRVKGFRRELVEKCAGKLKDYHPKVEMRRCDFSAEKTRKPTKRSNDDSNGNIHHPNRKMQRLDPDSLLGMTSSDVSVTFDTEAPTQPVPKPLIEGSHEMVEKEVSLSMKPKTEPSFEDGGEIETAVALVVEKIEDECDNDQDEPESIDDSADSSVSGPQSSELDYETAGTEAKNGNSIEFNTENVSELHDLSMDSAPNFAEPDEEHATLDPIAMNSESKKPFLHIESDFNSSSSSFKPHGTETMKPSSTAKARSAGKREVDSGRQLSLRRRYPCTTSSQKFSSSKKLQEHAEACAKSESSSSEGDEESETNQLSEDDPGDDGDTSDEETSSNEFESKELQVQKSKKRRKAKPYDFMQTKFKCAAEKCSSFFYNLADLENHSRLHGTFKCSSCDTTLSYAPHLALHELRHKGNLEKVKSLSCPHEKCLYRIDKVREFVNHFLQFHLKLLKQSVHTCPVCQCEVDADDTTDIGSQRNSSRRRKNGSSRILRHFKKNHDLKDLSMKEAFRCDIPNCPAYFLKSSQLSYHKLVVHKRLDKDLDNINCEECHDGFRTKCALNRHKKVMHAEKFQVSCKIEGCKKRFELKKQMLRHLVRDHNHNWETANLSSDDDDDDDFEDLEPYDFMKTKFSCSEDKCDSHFYNQADLENHSKLHGTFNCSSCDTALSYAPQLAIHELKHKGNLENVKGLSCPHDNCLYKTEKVRSFVNHFLQFHLKLLKQSVHTCPVCQCEVDAEVVRGKTRRRPKNGSWRLMEHFKSNHDLKELSMKEAFRCDIPNCPAYFLKPSQLSYHKHVIHMRVGDEKRDFICAECDDRFRTKCALMRHQKVIHAEKFRLSCEIKGCKKRFRNKTHMQKHVLHDHGGEGAHVCPFCGRTFVFRDDMIYHQNQVHGKIPLDGDPVSKKSPTDNPDEELKCPVDTCQEKFYDPQKLEAHSLLHGNFKCHFCEEAKTYAPDLALHELSSHKRRNVRVCKSKLKQDAFSCARCDFHFARSETQYVQHHVRTHLKLDMVVHNKCCICKLAFGKYAYTKRFAKHYKTHHDIREVDDHNNSLTRYHCDEEKCEGAYFLNEDQLTYHNSILHNKSIGKHTCAKCKKTFAERWILRKHKMKCDKAKLKIPCTFEGCPSRFENEQSMRTHFSSGHSQKVKEELCSHCGKTFVGLNALTMHVRKVHGPVILKPVRKPSKDYICPKCGKRFSNSMQLNIHDLGVHVGPEGWKYVCSECGKKCMTKPKLEEHQRIHTNEKPFACERCGLRYAHRHNFRHHMKNKHGITLEPPKRIRKKKEQNPMDYSESER